MVESDQRARRALGMKPMDWVEILKLAGIQSVPMALALVVVVLLGRKMAEVLLKRMTDLRRLELEKNLEKYKADLAQAAHSQQVVFLKLHERRAEAIVRLAGLLKSIELAMQRLVSLVGLTTDPSKEGQAESASKAASEFFHYYYENQILFDDVTCEVIDKMAGKYDGALLNMWFLIQPAPDMNVQDKSDLWKNAYKAITEDIPPLAGRLRADLRALLGVSGPQYETRQLPQGSTARES
jgi:hypothetical protein